MDYIYWGALLACSGIAFIIGIGVGGLVLAMRIDARNARMAGDEEQELGI